MTKRLLEKSLEEEERKKELLMELPEQFDQAVGFLTERIETSAVRINELEVALRESSSLKSKLKDYLIGGSIGAVIGLIMSIVFL